MNTKLYAARIFVQRRTGSRAGKNTGISKKALRSIDRQRFLMNGP
ncbi:hypothetical protein [Burkholderia aenigmatica]|nr:hypothetical protein [Burkholderia aenigmatica]